MWERVSFEKPRALTECLHCALLLRQAPYVLSHLKDVGMLSGRNGHFTQR